MTITAKKKRKKSKLLFRPSISEANVIGSFFFSSISISISISIAIPTPSMSNESPGEFSSLNIAKG